MKTQVFVLAFVITCCGSAGAKTPDVCATSNATTFDGWVQSLIDSVICKQQVGENGKGSDRQKESPSADPRSTSLVDQSSATDFFSVAANVIPVSQELSKFVAPGTTSSDAGASGSTTVTATLYALLAGFDKTSPTDPVFYKNHVNARRISFTIGTAVSTQATDNTTTPATVYGTKILLINGRDLYTRKNLDAVSAAQKAVSIAAATSVNMKARVKEVMFLTLHPDGGEKEREDFNLTAFSEVNLPNTLRALSPEALKQIQTLIEGFIDAFVGERKTLQDAYDQIHNARQMSISYTADIRDAAGNNDHRAELIFDYGLNPRINWTVNASADYTDRKSAADSKGGRFATSFQGDLTKSNSAWGKTPIRLTFSGEGKWQTSQKPQYTFESKLSIPLVSGIDLPIVYRYANRIAQINQTNSEARLGLSIDISRLAQAFK